MLSTYKAFLASGAAFALVGLGMKRACAVLSRSPFSRFSSGPREATASLCNESTVSGKRWINLLDFEDAVSCSLA